MVETPFLSMKVRQAKQDDLQEMWEIVQQAISYFRDGNINQWQLGYPNEETLKQDIQSGNSYVLDEKGKVVGVCYIAQMIDPNYAIIEDGKWINDEDYIVIHRIAIHPTYKGKHLADLFMKKALELASAYHINNLRVDTHPENQSMQRWIERQQFQRVGVVYVGNHEKRYAYQRVLACT